jgi:ribonuclease P protein component
VGAERPERPLPDGVAPGGERFPRSSRVHRSGEIRALFRRGKRRRTTHLDVFLAASPVSRPRVGIVVGKYGHGSVERNTLKRRLRELSRTAVLPRLWSVGISLDVLVRARREAYGVPFTELGRELDGVMEEVCSGRSWSG